MTTSRYGRVRKPSYLARAAQSAWYHDDTFVPGYKKYATLADFMFKNYTCGELGDSLWTFVGKKPDYSR